MCFTCGRMSQVCSADGVLHHIALLVVIYNTYVVCHSCALQVVAWSNVCFNQTYSNRNRRETSYNQLLLFFNSVTLIIVTHFFKSFSV